MKDLMNMLHFLVSIIPGTRNNIGTTPIVGAIIDRRGYESLTYVICTGALTDANATYTVLLEESDDSGLSGSNAVADDDLISTEAQASFTFAADSVCKKLGYRGTKRYTRLTITPAAADAGDSPIAAIAVLGNPNAIPTPTL